MNDKQANRLPPIVVQYINKLNDPSQSQSTRDQAAFQLELIRDQVTIALAAYNKQTRKSARV